MSFRYFRFTVLAVYLVATPLVAQPAACIIETLAGGQDTPVGDGGLAVDADLAAYDIAYGPDGLLYVADSVHWLFDESVRTASLSA